MSSQDETRVISCDFKIQVPANALRIDMTMLVSTKNDNNCQEDNPTVFYKITICTPRCKNENHDRINTISELKWSSKFTVAKGKDNTDPFHEWSGSFDLGKKTQIDLTDCCFQQLQGSFSAHYNDSIDSIKKPIPEARQIRKINEASTGATRAMPERKRRRMDAFVQDKRLRI